MSVWIIILTGVICLFVGFHANGLWRQYQSYLSHRRMMDFINSQVQIIESHKINHPINEEEVQA